MQVVLRVVGGKNDGREITIAVPRFIIGRGETAHLRPSSDLVSREHCAIVVGEDGAVTISDLGSRNGTFVNGNQLSAEHAAQSGDSLRVGRLHFEVVIDPVKAGTKKPKVADVVEAASRAASAKKKMSLEDSITDWLMDGEVDDEPTTNERTQIASAETIQLNLEETSVFGGSNVDRTKKEEEEESTDESDSGSKKKAGKLPAIPKNTHESSTSAADDVLRKFFNRR